MAEETIDSPWPGLLSAELSVLYEISTLSMAETEAPVFEEVVEKASRLFPVRHIAIVESGGGQDRVRLCWGFRDERVVAGRIRELQSNRFIHAFGPAGQQTWLYMEQASPLSPRERRLYTLFARRFESVLMATRHVQERRRVEEQQRAMTEGLRMVVEIADELITCPDVDRIYRRAVELAREKLGLERCSIFISENGLARGTYGTDFERRTTDERTHAFPMNEEWQRRFRARNPDEPPWTLEESAYLYWDGSRLVESGRGWIATTPIIRTGQRPVAVFFNDGGVAHKPFDPARQEVVAVFSSLLGDIIERKRAEEQLGRAESRYRTLVEQLPAITYIVALGEGSRTIYISPQVESLLGYSPGEWIGNRDLWRNSLHPDDRERVLAEVGVKDRSGEAYLIEYRVVARDGSVRWFRNQAVYLRNEAGHPQFVHGVMLDITERREAERELEEYRNHLEELVRERTAELNAKNEQLRVEMAERIQAEEEGRALEREMLEAKEREMMERTNRLTSLGLLAAGMAHEVNNPLQGMLSHLHAVKKALPADFAKNESVAMVEAGIQSIADLVRKLLVLSREPTGTLETASCAEALGFVLQLLDQQFRNTDIRILRKGEDFPQRLAIAHRDLVQVLINLFINARDAMPKGGRLTVTTEMEPGWGLIRLRDTGKGIPKRIMAQIFSPFFTTKGARGTGLGLSVTESLIRHCGGSIEVDSKPGKGSTFLLRIPLAAEKKR